MTDDPDSTSRELLMQQASTLRGAALRFRKYRRFSEEWDHDHCAVCWVKFAEWDGSNILHEGYATTAEYEWGGENYDWVCPRCFELLKSDMEWHLVE